MEVEFKIFFDGGMVESTGEESSPWLYPDVARYLAKRSA